MSAEGLHRDVGQPAPASVRDERSRLVVCGQRHAGMLVSSAALAVLLALVCLRSWVFVWFPHSHMDSDQAVFGLMGKDIALGRGYPLFMYGQRYMLAVSSWLCAPLFWLFGASVTTLKMPMFAMNLACVLMLWFGLRRERALGVWGTSLAVLPFATVNVVVASRLVEHQGGNVEPIFFLLLAFLLREAPVALGAVLGIAFLNREFAALGLIAMMFMDAVQGRTRARLRSYAITLAVAGSLVVLIRHVASTQPGYHGTAAHGSFQDVLSGEGIAAFLDQQLPMLLGSVRIELIQFVTSRLHGGHDFLRYLTPAWVLLGVIGAVRQRRSDFDGLSTYLILIGLGQAAAFILLCASPRDPTLVRYVLLTLCVWPGLTAYAWRTPGLRPLVASIVLAAGIANTRDHVRVAREYIRNPPRHENELLAEELEKRGVRFAIADYWIAYDVAWLTDERIIASPPSGKADRIARYRGLLTQNAQHVVRIRETPCRRGERVLRWHLCR